MPLVQEGEKSVSLTAAALECFIAVDNNDTLYGGRGKVREQNPDTSTLEFSIRWLMRF